MGKVVTITIKPRLQKDRWSLYWKVRLAPVCDHQRQPTACRARTYRCLALQESMETKTESLDDLQLSLSLTQTVAELQLLVSKQCKWEPIDSLERQAAQAILSVNAYTGVGQQRSVHLCRLEGFKEPWEHCVYKGNLLQPSSTLQECGIDGAAPVVAVRKSLFPEGMKELILAWPGPSNIGFLTLASCAGWKILQDDEVDFSSSDDGF